MGRRSPLYFLKTNFILGAIQQWILTSSNKIKIWKTRIWALCPSSTTWYPIKSWYFRNSWNRKYFWPGTSSTWIAPFGSSGSRKSRWTTFGCFATSGTSSRCRRIGNKSTRIPTVKLKIHGKSRIPKFCYIQVIVFDLSYLPVPAVGI